MKRHGEKHAKSQCSGKARYRDVNQAQFEIDRAKQFRSETLRAYICHRCGAVHLTSMSLQEYRKGKR